MRDFDWQMLVTLSHTGSITKTAELLFISQPALTKRIRAVEEELGVSLLVRTRTGSRFTPDGERVVRRAEHIVGIIQEVRDLSLGRQSGESGLLRLGFPHSFVRAVMPNVLERFSREYPMVDVDVHTMQSSDLIRCVEDGVLDVCFSRYLVEDCSLERTLFSQDQSCIVFHRPFSPEELPSLPCIDYERNPGIQTDLRLWWSERFTARQDVRYRVMDSDACLTLVQRGLGWGFTLDARFTESAPELCYLPLEFLDGRKLIRSTWALSRRESRENPVVRNFLRLMENPEL